MARFISKLEIFLGVGNPEKVNKNC